MGLDAKRELQKLLNYLTFGVITILFMNIVSQLMDKPVMINGQVFYVGFSGMVFFCYVLVFIVVIALNNKYHFLKVKNRKK